MKKNIIFIIFVGIVIANGIVWWNTHNRTEFGFGDEIYYYKNSIDFLTLTEYSYCLFKNGSALEVHPNIFKGKKLVFVKSSKENVTSTVDFIEVTKKKKVWGKKIVSTETIDCRRKRAPAICANGARIMNNFYQGYIQDKFLIEIDNL